MKTLAFSTATALLLLAVGCGGPPESTEPVSQPAAAGSEAVPVNPERDVYFGDLHIHTMLSMDAYYLFGTRLGPEDAYRFARGEEVMYMGEPIRRRRPLDFMAVTDHGQILGSGMAMEDPDSALATSAVGRQFRADQRRYLGSPGYQAWRAQTAGEVPGFDIAPL